MDKDIASILGRHGKEISILEQIKKYVVTSGGKRVRPLLLVLLSELTDKKKFSLACSVGAVVEIIHAASLLHDDVLDNADTRRGERSGKARFGSKEVILGGDYLLACAIEHLHHLGYPSLLTAFTKTIRDLSSSELLQMQYEKNPRINLSIYKKIIYGKTASLFESACFAAGVIHNLPQEKLLSLARFGQGVGNLFQMRDDHLDYFNAKLLNKPAFSDFVGGLFTFPILLLREQSRQNKKTIDGFFAHSQEERKSKELQKQLQNFLQETKVEQLSRGAIQKEFKTIEGILKQFHGETAATLGQQLSKLMSF